MSQKTLTTLTIKVGKEEYEILYSGIIDSDSADFDKAQMRSADIDKEMRKSIQHDFRIMKVLLHDDRAYELFQRLLLPVIRQRKRQIKKLRKAAFAQTPTSLPANQ